MALKTSSLAAATAVAAAFSLLATPVAAVELPRPAAPQVYEGDALNAERHRRWRRGNDIDAGDIVAGVLVIGAIAAISGAARNARDRDRYGRGYPYPNDDYGYRTRGGYERGDGRGIERAVDMCVGEVERGRDRVGSVDSATRSAEGWHVSGELEDGSAYSCTIDNDGRIREVDLGSYGYGTVPGGAIEDNEWDDDYYSRARVQQGYPGDGRYETARAPHFED